MDIKRNMLWISSIAWMREDNSYFPEATYPGIVSGSAFQQAIIEGLEYHGHKVKILSDCDMSSGERIEWSHNNVSKDVRVAGNKNKILRIPTKIKELFKELKKDDFLEKIDIVFAYEMHIPFLMCLYKIKKINPNIKTVLICPDLSIYMDLDASKKRLKSFLKKIENRVAMFLLNKVDGYVLFTEQMQDYFNKYNKPYVVVEGVYRDKYNVEKTENVNAQKSYIMHAGSLHYNIGIEELIEAFEKLAYENIELWFFGSGAMDNYIREKAENNKNIKHKGFVDPKKLFEYEQQAILLVNVRNPEAEYTKYSFPSKTFEYLASGTPFLSTKLKGIPNEYEEHILLIEDNNVETIEAGLKKALELTDKQREEFGHQASEFVKKNKNKIVQSNKILEMVLKL